MINHRGEASTHIVGDFVFSELAALAKGGVAQKLNQGLADYAEATKAKEAFTTKVFASSLLVLIA